VEIGTQLWRRLEQFHATCRQEVEQPDDLTNLALKQLHLMIDITVARIVRSRFRPPEPSVRIELALRWMAQNLAAPNPVSALCEYLQISPATVVRMFQTYYREPPAVYHQQLKMTKAQQLLETGHLSVKQISCSLGYKHPNNFSRSFRQFFGTRPKDIGNNTNRRERR
jgi:transcriptional regulator GlxA family with amidase domain